MRIAITGSSGRVGQGVVALALARGHEVVLVDRLPSGRNPHPDVPFIQAEMSDYDALVAAFAGCDGLIHLAAIPAPGRDRDHVIHNSNVVGSYNALRAAVENGIKRVCQASSVNAIGHAFSRTPRYDYFPLDENHPNYSEEPYSLSKWICEEQGAAFARRYEDMAIASMRFHLVVPERAMAIAFHADNPHVGKHLWAWTRLDAAADACLLSLAAPFLGHEAFNIVSPTTIVDTPSLELAARHFHEVPVTGDLAGTNSFFNSTKAERMLGWRHDPAGGGSAR